QARADVDLVAADWAVRRAEGLTPEEHAEFDAWLAEAPAHWRAYKDSDRVWGELAGMDLRAQEPQADRSRRRWLAGAGAIAASLVAAVVGYQALSSMPQGVYQSGRGEIRNVRLADGSAVTLGADSAIAVRFDEDGRHVRLRRGEAMFDVTHDPARPFDVRAGDTEVTVLGTRFTVKAAPDAVRVNVIRGVVRVEKKEPALVAALMPPPPAHQITRGERLESRRGEPLQPLPDADPAEAAPWTQGRLVYENASLAEVVADLNRYSPAHIELSGRDLGELRVTAALNQDQVGQFLTSLPVTLPVRVRRDGANRVVIAPAE
ncbi:MAG TPA: FecR domain-containing protein, partial [Caulobacteraceae bacterium]